jgi:hypothetical protein
LVYGDVGYGMVVLPEEFILRMADAVRRGAHPPLSMETLGSVSVDVLPEDLADLIPEVEPLGGLPRVDVREVDLIKMAPEMRSRGYRLRRDDQLLEQLCG